MRTSRVLKAAAVLIAVGVVAFGAVWLGRSEPAPAAKAPHAAQSVDFDGWRWESFGGIEVRVPGDWKWGTVDGLLCKLNPGQASSVSRPGFTTASGCAPNVPPRNPPSVLWLNFPIPGHPPPAVTRFHDGWVLETRNFHGVWLEVLSNEDAVREAILDSARVITGEASHGCAPEHPISDDHRLRPAASEGGLATVGEAESISVCRYPLFGRWSADRHDTPGSLLGSRQVTGEQAREELHALLAAPEGTGPNSPDNCLGKYGEEVLVLHVRGSERTQEVVMRVSGCDHHGTDDGATLRRLTKESVQPLLLGGTRLQWGVNGYWMAKIVGFE